MTRSTLAALAADLDAGRTSARALVEACLARIEDPAGQGGSVFVSVDRVGALAAADAADRQRRAGVAPGPFAGIPLAIKDLFEVRGQVTAAGSTVLADAPPAPVDCPAVERMRQAGFVLIGRANMTEFAFSGLGINPHHGTPLSPWDRGEKHVAGGSSSGSAAAVADGMAYGALGTDTGGSCRIPAAFCGIVGFKPTARRVPRDGVVPLSTSLDSVGPLANSVACCATLDAILSADPVDTQPARQPAGLRIAVPAGIAIEGLDPAVATAFAAVLSKLSAAGAAIDEIPVPEFEAVAGLNARGGLTAAESFAWHRSLLAERGSGYDPRVRVRIARGEALSAADYIDMLAARAALVAGATARLAPYDAFLMPTVAIPPPRLAELVRDEDYGRINLLALRNCTFVNMMDGCAVSIPIGEPGGPPVGLGICGTAGRDRAILSVAAGIEALLG